MNVFPASRSSAISGRDCVGCVYVDTYAVGVRVRTTTQGMFKFKLVNLSSCKYNDDKIRTYI